MFWFYIHVLSFTVTGNNLYLKYENTYMPTLLMTIVIIKCCDDTMNSNHCHKTSQVELYIHIHCFSMDKL